MSISVLILTLNEEINLPACLAGVAWSDDIVVLASFSTDRTVKKHNRYSWLEARESLRSPRASVSTGEASWTGMTPCAAAGT
jgi:hypothetical protein